MSQTTPGTQESTPKGAEAEPATQPPSAAPPTVVLSQFEEEPPPRSRTWLYSLVGLVVALAAAGVYYFYYLRRIQEQMPPPAPVATLTTLAGEVGVKPAGQEDWHDAKPGEFLRPSDQLRTAVRSGAEVTFASGSLVRVRPESVVLIGDPEAETASGVLRVEAGRANFEAGDRTEILTPNARTMTVGESVGDIDVNEEGRTGIRIFKGSAQVATASGESVTLKQNEGVFVSKGGEAGRKAALPEPPALVGPAQRAELLFVPPPALTTTLLWQVGANAKTYRIAMDINVVQANLLLSAALDKSGIEGGAYGLEGLDAGRYYWRVAGVNEEGMEGAFSVVQLFSVTRPAATGEEPRLLIESVELLGDVVQIRGRATPGSSVTVDGHPVTLQEDGRFSEFVKRERAVIVIEARSPDGRITSLERALGGGD